MGSSRRPPAPEILGGEESDIRESVPTMMPMSVPILILILIPIPILMHLSLSVRSVFTP